ncbi:unnamed protein product [Sphenostylis stenocarpa]|uniref:Transmembrane protein n=1 Tax=Sphenostylis stenocarpa TaxID=92480 RepID=A0AA86V6Z8_9FABA|nr:unnamed protein product [Sphenostylis stenocarpa]
MDGVKPTKSEKIKPARTLSEKKYSLHYSSVSCHRRRSFFCLALAFAHFVYWASEVLEFRFGWKGMGLID